MPTKQQFKIKQKHQWTQSEELTQLLSQSELLTHLAFRGPGQAPEPDWWVLLPIDRRSSSEGFKRKNWLLIQGQSKMRSSPQQLKWADVEVEYAKRFRPRGAHIAHLFIYVTDERLPEEQTLPDTDDLLLITKERLGRFYGVIGSIKRRAIDVVMHGE